MSEETPSSPAVPGVRVFKVALTLPVPALAQCFKTGDQAARNSLVAIFREGTPGLPVFAGLDVIERVVAALADALSASIRDDQDALAHRLTAPALFLWAVWGLLEAHPEWSEDRLEWTALVGLERSARALVPKLLRESATFHLPPQLTHDDRADAAGLAELATLVAMPEPEARA